MSNEYLKSDKDLRELATNVKKNLLLCCNGDCTKQYTKSSTIWKKDIDYDWLLRLKCNKCKMEWAVCYTCSSCKTALLKPRQISLHKNSYHKHNRSNVLTKKKKDRVDDIEVKIKSKKHKVNDDVIENDNIDLVDIEDLDNNDLVVFDDLVDTYVDLVNIEDLVVIDELTSKKGMVFILFFYYP